jgi:ElaB/YqjD/DUF883 family membrane-anchored ribosome-binding protein
MTQLSSDITVSGGPSSGSNIVDRASDTADRALEATRRLSDRAIDGMADRVHDLRDRASPAIDRLVSPYQDVLRYTQQTPVRALLISAAVGAGLMMMLGWMRSDR